ncbi:hypothetical protein Z965_05130 [Clostridium novyi A str. BKT29909]|uniref:hypothetical protein n=1 Tax=Clostridium TaxID=1485 RepID=UPI0004D69404|nr:MULTISPECIES: hypothetical protein [Clostridium]KEH87950.1 hypothetical protein Z965_05130 [Clostridium novyi A str. BKT29909]KEH92457.1 hypothetical protein Z963_05645 [Clostridium botulinum C/D str. It1]
MEINKYLSLDISLHKTLYDINKNYSNSILSYDSLLDILNINWLSTGYQSKHEESLFRSYATNAIKLYFLNPLDKGCDILLLDKFITFKEDSNLICCKVDKLHFLSNDKLELIDYKTGKYIPSIDKYFNSYKTFLTVYSIKKKLGVYPDIFSLYYLQHGLKFSTFINIDVMYSINHKRYGRF